MALTLRPTFANRDRSVAARSSGSPTYQAYRILHVGFTALPLVAGIDKFFDALVPWTSYLAPIVPSTLGVAPQTFMYGVGAVEILAAVLVACVPFIGGWVVAAWLAGIIGNLLIQGTFYDIALRDVGLLVGAVALARIAVAYRHPTTIEPERR
jgi:hypothetical protein